LAADLALRQLDEKGAEWLRDSAHVFGRHQPLRGTDRQRAQIVQHRVSARFVYFQVGLRMKSDGPACAASHHTRSAINCASVPEGRKTAASLPSSPATRAELLEPPAAAVTVELECVGRRRGEIGKRALDGDGFVAGQRVRALGSQPSEFFVSHRGARGKR